MNYFHFLYPKHFLGLIISLFLITSSYCIAQTRTDILSKEELNAINNQPIAPKVNAADRIQGVQKRDKSYTLEEPNGTKVDEYRDVGQNVAIEVESSMGTHYEMSPPLSRDGVSTNQVINRVPSINLPF
jgi:hypothetical protein